MTKILFVDDEERVLSGLRRMLFTFQGEWDMSFASSGELALEEMERAHFDVIVSDMRMPGMNGNEVLAEVQKRYPDTVRILLSGHADKALILESTRYAHQYLSKPCDENELKSTIDRCCHLQALLAESGLVKVVCSLTTIPSLPALYTEIVQAVDDDSMTLHDIGDIIAKDVGMSAKILQLVNSAFFGLPRQVANVADAVSFLGIDTVKSLVLSVKLFSQFSEDRVSGLDLAQVAEHSMGTGSLARLVAKAEGAPKAVIDHAFLAGTLHDAGKLVLAANLPREYEEALALSRSEGIEIIEAERRVIGSTHAQVGAYLFSAWALPQPIVEAIAHHHAPGECPATSFTPLTAVHVANVLQRASGCGRAEGVEAPAGSAIDEDYLARLGLVDRLPAWREACAPVTGEQEAR